MRKRTWERRSLCAPGAAAIVCGLALAALLPSTAIADTMSLGLSAEAVQNATTQITYTASSEVEAFVTLAVNNADVPCGSSPEDDSGTSILEPHAPTATQAGVLMGSTSFEPTELGAFIICGWVTGYGGSFNIDGEVFAAASLPIAVRPPHISLALSLPRGITQGKPFTLDLMASSEVARELIVVGVPDTPEGCPANSSATAAGHLIDSVIDGGPSLKTAIVNALPAGSRWIFCAWAVVPGAVTPEASTSMIVSVPGSQPKPSSGSRPEPRSKGKGHEKSRSGGGKARACGTEQLADRYTATIRAGGISCKRAHGVVHAVEHAPWPKGVAVPPYYTYSQPYGVSTEAGRFTCRFEPFGLAGTEHNIHCKQGQASVSWYTWQD
jgi:hypothetical protein